MQSFFNKLPKEKRDRIIAIAIGTVMVLVGLWFGVVSPEYGTLQITGRKIADAQGKVRNAEQTIKSGPKVQQELDATARDLNAKEDDMAAGDLYSWFFKTLKAFQANYRVNIVDIKDQLVAPVRLLPDFPYSAVTFKVSLAGYYHDLGKFLADFENRFPYMRVENIVIQQPDTPAPEDPEKLSCKMAIVLLKKP
jgi:Type II secretion system (T2SS), protein M subtype b